jgi:hypothetical protein
MGNHRAVFVCVRLPFIFAALSRRRNMNRSCLMLKSLGAYAAVAMIALVACAAPVQADDPAYLDDRSSPEAVISSYYNAIDRSEYARAYSYFGKDAAPEYDPWEFGYSDTGHVEVSFGQVAQEGAAGSIYYTLPVTLDVTSTEGVEHWFYAGCYQLRLVQPANQTPPFEGIHIESADLKKQPGRPFAPAKCD